MRQVIDLQDVIIFQIQQILLDGMLQKDIFKALKSKMRDLYILHIMKVIQGLKKRLTEENNGS